MPAEIVTQPIEPIEIPQEILNNLVEQINSIVSEPQVALLEGYWKVGDIVVSESEYPKSLTCFRKS